MSDLDQLWRDIVQFNAKTPRTKKNKIIIGLLLGFFLFTLFNQIAVIFKYVVFNMRFDNEDMDILGTMHSRLAQWHDLKTIFSEPAFLLHGIGIGNYGLTHGGNAELGLHNLFLDHLVASGLYGVIMLAFIIIYGAIKSLRLTDKRILIAYLFFICLAFREYTFAYAYVTSMGGLIFVFMLYLTFNPTQKYLKNNRRQITSLTVSHPAMNYQGVKPTHP